MLWNSIVIAVITLYSIYPRLYLINTLVIYLLPVAFVVNLLLFFGYFDYFFLAYLSWAGILVELKPGLWNQS